MKYFFLLLGLSLFYFAGAQTLSNATQINIVKVWPQEPSGWPYPIAVYVPPGTAPPTGFPVCIALHGNGGNGNFTLNLFKSILDCHIIVAPSGYMNSWNICGENSEAPDTEMINDLIDSLKNYSNVNPNAIRIAGTSNGAGLTNRVFIENKDPALDAFVPIVSQLNTPQYHNGDFYAPSGVTDNSNPYCSYDSPQSLINNRKYLGISNINDPVIPYNGGNAVGTSFLAAEDAIFYIAQSQGYTGSKISSGTQLNNSSSYTFSYLNGQVVLLNGLANHATDSTQENYIKQFLDDCNQSVALDIIEEAQRISPHPNPFTHYISINNGDNEISVASLINVYGQIVLKTELMPGMNSIDLITLPSGIYFIEVNNHICKVFKAK